MVVKISLCLFLTLFSFKIFSFDHNYTKWEEILKKHLTKKNGQAFINYGALKKDPKKLLMVLGQLSKVSEKEYSNWSSNQKLAFLINAYNAFTLKLIIKHYPVKSIKDIGGIISTPWKKKFFSLLGQKRTLDELEHQLIRGKFKEARVHFALVCASISCPNLQSFAFIPSKLEEQLETSTNDFLKDTNKNRLVTGEKKLYLSKIFSWYEVDFKKDFGSLDNFLSNYLGPDKNWKQLIKNGKVKKKFLSYDWNLNDWK